MFGRRNPDYPPVAPPPPSGEAMNLDLLPDIPDIPPPAPLDPAQYSPPTSPADPAWHASAPLSPDPAATQRLPALDEPAPAPAAPTTLPSASTDRTSGGAEASQPKTTTESVIGPDDFFDGRYRSERGVRIQGNARGSIESRQYIFVEASAQVEADLSAEDITVAGSFNGKIDCRRRLIVTGSGKVQGHVQTVLLVVQEGGVLDGELHMDGAQTGPTLQESGAQSPGA